jgi:hypothetical protein
LTRLLIHVRGSHRAQLERVLNGAHVGRSVISRGSPRHNPHFQDAPTVSGEAPARSRAGCGMTLAKGLTSNPATTRRLPTS